MKKQKSTGLDDLYDDGGFMVSLGWWLDDYFIVPMIQNKGILGHMSESCHLSDDPNNEYKTLPRS